MGMEVKDLYLFFMMFNMMFNDFGWNYAEYDLFTWGEQQKESAIIQNMF